MATGGDITEIRYSHPTLGQGVFFPIANQGNTFDIGGIRTADDANMISGSGEPVWQLNRVRGHFECLVENDMNVRNDAKIASDLAASPVAKIASDLAASPVAADWTVSVINGTVWSGSGKPVGDIAPDVNASTFTLKIAAGTWKKQA